MSNTHLTRCPHCQATFKVQDQHLSAAGGKVRCGSCLEVFNALESLVNPNQGSQKPEPKAASEAQENKTQTPKSAPSKTPVSEPENTQDNEDDDELVFADNPDEDSEDEGYTGPGAFSSELSDSFLELEEGGSDHFSEQELDDSLSNGVISKKAGSDESWAEQMLEDIEGEKKPTPIPPKHENANPTEHLKIDDDAQLFSTEFAALDQDANKSEAQPTSHQHHKPEPVTANSPHHTESKSGERSPHTASTDLSHQYQNLKSDPLDLPRSSGRSVIGSFIWTTLNLSLLIVLLAQLSWFHYDKLAQFDQLTPLYKKGCELVGCELPELVDTAKIKSQNLVVRSHPTARKALIIDAVIVNQASFDQSFPNLALYFSDLNNNIIAQRLFEPSDYLAGEIKNWPTMPKNTPIHISIEIMDPGKNAVNYSVGFFKHTPQDKI